jgi:O-antigen/teichoic acid export membrane protein
VTVAVTYTFVVVFRARVSGLLWSAVISSIVMAIALTVSYILRKPGAFVPALFRQMLAFSMPLGLSGIALLIVHSGDRFFLQRYGDLNALGIYGLAYKLGMMISYLQASFGTYWTANMYKVLDGEGTQKIFERINTYQMLATTYGALIVIAFSSPFLHLAGRPQFAACLPYGPFIAAAYVVRSQGDYLRMSLWVDRRVGLDASLNWAGALFCLAAYALLIPRWTLWGAIAATFLTFSFVLVIAYRKARQLREFRLEYQRLFLLSGLAVVLCGLAVGAKDEPATITLPLGLVLVAAYPLLLCMAGFWLPSERHAISVLYSRVRSTLGARTWRSRHLTRDTARQPEISAPSAR